MNNRIWKKIARAACLLSLLSLTGCNCFLLGDCCLVDIEMTPESALKAMREGVVEKYGDVLEQIGADASMFENVELKNIGTHSCDRPQKFLVIHELPKGGEWGLDRKMSVSVEEIKKGPCNNCWDSLMVSGTLSRCGQFYIRSWSRNSNTRLLTLEGPRQCGPAR